MDSLRVFARVASVCGAFLLVAACSSSKGGPAGTPPAGACATEHPGTTADGDAVTVCDATFGEAPLVRAPADDTSNPAEATIYGALTWDLNLVDRDGKSYVLLDPKGDPIIKGVDSIIDPPAPVQPEGLRMLSNRYLFLVYRVTGKVETTANDDAEQVPALRVATASPAILLPGKVIDALLSGAWEGTASRRTGDDHYDSEQRVPVRLSLPKLTAMENVSVWGIMQETLADGTRFAATGTIENLTQGVRAADGSCMPALSTLGDANPFYGATSGDVRLLRFPSMHAHGADQIVLDFPIGSEHGVNGMSPEFAFVTPAGFLRAAPPADWSHQTVAPHGAPNGQLVDIRPVTAGGGGC